MHAWLLCSFGALTCWLWWLIILIEDSDVAFSFLCFIVIFVWEIDMLIMFIDYFVYLSIVTLILPWLFCSPHMYRLIVVYHLTWCVDFLDRILSWSFLSMLSLSLFVLIVIFSFSLCVDMDDILAFCLTVIFIWDINVMMTLIDSFYYLSILILLLPWLSCFLCCISCLY